MVLRLGLKLSRVAAFLSEDGRAFHNLGEVYKKALAPYDLVLGVAIDRKFWEKREDLGS